MRSFVWLLVFLGLPARAAVQEIQYAGEKRKVPATLVTPAAKGRVPAIIYVHWGPGNRSEFLPEARFLAGRGVASLLVDAPPWSDTDHAGVVAQTVTDVDRGIDLLVRRGDIDPKRIAFVGHSFGSHVGTILAGREKRIAFYVLMGGLANVPGTEAIDPVKMIPAAKVPVFLQFARRDEYVSLEQAEKLIAATPEPKVWRIYDGDHGMGDRARADRIAWLLGHLGLPQVPSPDPPRLAPPEVPVPDAPELFWLRIVAERPGSDAVTVRRDLGYNKNYKLDVYLPAPDPEKPPVVVLVHGQAPPSVLRRFKDGGPMTSQARYLAARGFAVVVPNLGSAARGPERERWYEGVGDVARNLDDAIAYVKAHAAELGVDAEKMCLMVFSAGGAYGVAAALTRPGIRSIVAWNTFLTSDYLGPNKQEWSPAAKIRAGSPPVLVVRSQRDFPELNAATETFLGEAKKQGANVTVLEIPDGHHAADIFDDTEDTREVMRKTVRFLVKSVQ